MKDQSKNSGFEDTGKLTLTGIQVLNPEILSLIPDNAYYSIVDVYRTLTAKNRKICAFVSKKYFWKDMGTPERYQNVVFEKMAPEAFKQAFLGSSSKKITRTKLKGDGSDRDWYRLNDGNRSLVMADHGIKREDKTSEAEAFVAMAVICSAAGYRYRRFTFMIPFQVWYLWKTWETFIFRPLY